MAERPHLTCHCDEALALRAELADQAELAGAMALAYRAEVCRLEQDNGQLRANVDFWRKQAELADQRARQIYYALLLAGGS